MAKFKVGDRVKAIQKEDGGFIKPRENVYTVKLVGESNLIKLVEADGFWYRDDRFELYEEPLPVWVYTLEPDERPHSHYYKDFGAYLDQETGRVLVDVYAVLDEFEVKEPELQHLAKKVLCLGMRGHKLADEDLDNIIDTAKRLKERRQLKALYKGRG